MKFEQKLNTIKLFKDWLELLVNDSANNNMMDNLYCNDFIISFMGKHCPIPFGAEEYQYIIDILTDFITEQE